MDNAPILGSWVHYPKEKNIIYRTIFLFLAHCDNPEDEILLDEETAALHQDYDHDQEIDIASAENEVLINKTEKKNNPNKKVKQHENSRSSRAHRILMNLDDKNRFTDEITV